MNQILVTAKVTPDLDGVSCMLAYADLLIRTGHPSQAVIYGTLQTETEYFVHHHHIQLQTHPDDGVGQWTQIVLVDSSSTKGMPRVVRAENVVEIIDHRDNHEPEKEFPQAKIQNELIGAAATLIVERFQSAHLLPQPDHAKLLYGAIFHNTLNFTTSNTSGRDHQAAYFLGQRFGLSSQIAIDMFDYITIRSQTNITQLLVEDSKVFEAAGDRIIAYQLTPWSFTPGENQAEISTTISKLDQQHSAIWSFLDVVDIQNKVTHIYSSYPKAKGILSRMLNINFTGDWATIPEVLLRKQILKKLKGV